MASVGPLSNNEETITHSISTFVMKYSNSMTLVAYMSSFDALLTTHSRNRLTILKGLLLFF